MRMITIPKPSIFYALSGSNGTPLGLRNRFVDDDPNTDTAAEVNKFWDEIEAIADQIDSIALHLMFGKAPDGGPMPFDSVYNIEQSTNPKVLIYYTLMRRRLERFLRTHREVRVDVYVGSLFGLAMQRLKRNGNQLEWDYRWNKEVGPVLDLIRQGLNARLVFDHSSTYPMRSLEWSYVKMLNNHIRPELGERIVIETMPKAINPEQRGMPCFVKESAYQGQVENALHPLGHVTRFITEIDDDAGLWSFIHSCAAAGHDYMISDVLIEESGLQPSEIQQRAQRRAVEID